jgi:NAD(P)-dependent dehydrogenase (short-subunit alcohol dehydrogenase family)
MDTELRDKNVLVTEIGNPLGRSTALAFAREGANLLLGSLEDSDSLSTAQRETAALGVKVVAAIYDTGSEDGVQQFVQRGLDEFVHIDILLNNMAWPAAKQSFAAMSFETWKRAIHLGLTGSLFVCRAVLPGMVERRWGRIIHCIGLEGFVGGDPATSASHAGLIGLTRGIATQYGKYRITANCIGYGGYDGLDNFPGAYPVAKLNDPLARYGTGEEVSSTAIYLASEDAGYITGQCYLVNGGKCFL